MRRTGFTLGLSWGAGGGGGGRAGRALHTAAGRAGHTSVHHGDTVQPASSWPCPTLALLAALESPGSPCHAPLPPHTHLLWVIFLLIFSPRCPCPTPSQGGLPPGPQMLISELATYPAPLQAGDTCPRTAPFPWPDGGHLTPTLVRAGKAISSVPSVTFLKLPHTTLPSRDMLRNL